MIGTNKRIPDSDAEEIGLPARHYLLQDGDRFVLLVDDIEYARLPQANEVFARYRAALDQILGPLQGKAAVHFMVPMIEAYYFADAAVLRSLLNLTIADYEGDVETMRHPKGELRRLHHGFDELKDGNRIVSHLNVEHVLDNPLTCPGLRTLFAWCTKGIGQPFGARFCLATGVYSTTTGPQLKALP